MTNPNYDLGVDEERRRLAREQAVTEAREEGMDVNYGGPCLLLLDLDSEEARSQALDLLARLKSTLGWTDVEQTRSRSGNYHLYVHLAKPLPLRERQLLAAALGSDPVREILGWDFSRRVDKSSDKSSEPFLFELPEAKAVELKLVTRTIHRWEEA